MKRACAHLTPRAVSCLVARLGVVLAVAAGCGELGAFPRPDGSAPPPAGDEERFALVALPDTQNIVVAHPERFYAQAYWIRDNAAALNIKYVVHEGDITNNSSDKEWDAADHAFRLLDDRVPYALALGNHDYPGGGSVEERDTSAFDERFPPSRIQGQRGFLGSFDPETLANAVYGFVGNGQYWLIFALEFGPRDEVLAWVEDTLEANPGANAILVTHAFLFVDGTRFDHVERTDQYSNPHDYDGDDRLGVNDAEEMWRKLIAKCPGIRLVLCGHMHAQARLTSERPDAPPVHQMLADYQGEEYGGQGYLRLLQFEPDGRIVVRTYSPFLERFRTDDDNQFVLRL